MLTDIIPRSIQALTPSRGRDVFTIKGEKKEEKESKKGGRHLSERRYGSFARTMRMPIGVDQDKISAKFNHGILTVNIPKNPETLKDIKRIPIAH